MEFSNLLKNYYHKIIKMKNLLIKLFGKKWYCKNFHTLYGIKWRPNRYKCSHDCGVVFEYASWMDDMGPG